jgi:hypothetical protein
MSSGTAIVLLVIPIVAWSIITQLWLVSICYRKHRTTLARIGLVGLVIPGLFVFPLVGAARLAPPSSSWAVLHYGDEFMGRSARRYPDDHDVAIGFSLPKETVTTWEKLIIAALVLTALGLIVLFGRTDYTGLASVIMLVQITVVAWLAEVELTAKPYVSRSVPATTPDPESVPAPH